MGKRDRAGGDLSPECRLSYSMTSQVSEVVESDPNHDKEEADNYAYPFSRNRTLRLEARGTRRTEVCDSYESVNLDETQKAGLITNPRKCAPAREDAPFDGSQGGFRCNTPMCARAHTGCCHWNRVRFLKGNAWKPVV